LAMDQPAGFFVDLVFDRSEFIPQFRSPAFQIFDQQRIAFYAGHNSGQNNVTEDAEEARQDRRIKPKHQGHREQSAAMAATMNQQDNSRQHAEIDMSKQPVAQGPGAPAVDLFARRISHYSGYPNQSHQSGHPTHRQPRAAQRLIETVV